MRNEENLADEPQSLLNPTFEGKKMLSVGDSQMKSGGVESHKITAWGLSS
jgi:hypothetical protein